MRRVRDRPPVTAGDVAWQRALWWTYAVAGSLFVLSRIDPTPGESATENVVIALVVVGSSAPLVWAASRLGSGRQLRGRLPWPVVYVLSVLATAIGAVAAALVGAAFDRPVQVSAQVILEVVVVGPIWIVVIGSAVVLWQFARTQRRLLTESLREIDSLVESGADVTRALEVVTMRELRHSLAEVRTPGAGDAMAMSVEDWQRISGELRAVSRDVVRPLSHDLPGLSEAGDTWQRSPVGWLRRIVSREDFNPLLVAAVFTAGAVSTRVGDYGWITGIALLLGENAVIFAVMLSANAWMRRVRRRAPVFVGAVVLLQIIPLIPWPQVLGETPAPTLGERIAGVIASVVLILIASGVKAIRTQAQERIEHLRALVGAASSAGSQEAAQIARITRDLAARLHGSIQATLVSTAYAIETAARESRWDDARRSLDALTSVLDETASEIPGGVATLREATERVCLPWRAVGEVNLELEDSGAELTGAVVQPVTRVIEEAVTNAFRHGLALRVDIEVSKVDDDIGIRVVDDGIGVTDVQQDRWGLGLASIEEATGGRWQLSSHAGVTEFQARLSFEVRSSG